MIRLEDLPPVLAEIAEIVGVDDALCIAKSVGGTAVYIPAQVNDEAHWLAALIGLENANLLCRHYRVGNASEIRGSDTAHMSLQGVNLTIPLAASVIRALKFQEAFDLGVPDNETARRVGCHIRTVRRYRAKLRQRRGSRLA